MSILVDVFYENRLEAQAIPLAEAFPSDPEAYADAYADLTTHGEHRCGGGAAPLFVFKFHGHQPAEDGVLRNCVSSPT